MLTDFFILLHVDYVDLVLFLSLSLSLLVPFSFLFDLLFLFFEQLSMDFWMLFANMFLQRTEIVKFLDTTKLWTFMFFSQILNVKLISYFNFMSLLVLFKIRIWAEAFVAKITNIRPLSAVLSFVSVLVWKLNLNYDYLREHFIATWMSARKVL